MSRTRKAEPDHALITRPELARRLGCNPQTIAKWIEEGLPVAQRGRGGRPSLYDEAAARTWRAARDSATSQQPDLLVARARKELAQAIEAEQRVAIRARTLLQVDEVERAWSAHVAAVRARLLAMPTALADQLLRAGATDGAAGIEHALQDAMHQALRELAAGADQKRPARQTTRRRGRAVRGRRRTET